MPRAPSRVSARLASVRASCCAAGLRLRLRPTPWCTVFRGLLGQHGTAHVAPRTVYLLAPSMCAFAARMQPEITSIPASACTALSARPPTHPRWPAPRCRWYAGRPKAWLGQRHVAHRWGHTALELRHRVQTIRSALFLGLYSERSRERQRDRETETETERQRDRDRARARERQRESESERETETERQRDRETERQRDRETERQRDRETERQRDRETERGTEREKETDRQTETDRQRARERKRQRQGARQTERQTQRHSDTETQRHRQRGRKTKGQRQSHTHVHAHHDTAWHLACLLPCQPWPLGATTAVCGKDFKWTNAMPTCAWDVAVATVAPAACVGMLWVSGGCGGSVVAAAAVVVVMVRAKLALLCS